MKKPSNRFKFYDVDRESKIHGTKNLANCVECDTDDFRVDYLGSDEVFINDKWFDIPSYSRRTGFNTENSEELLERVIKFTDSRVFDFFCGSGTTASAAYKMGRKWLTSELSDHIYKYALVRLKKTLHGEQYGISGNHGWKGGKLFKYIRLETYEDCLNNLAFNIEDADPEDSFNESYYLNYLLDHQTKGSPSLLNIEQFNDPTAYKLKVKKPGSDASVEQAVDLIETFNYLIGLRVETLSAPQSFSAKFVRPEDPDVPDDQLTKLQLDGRFKQDTDGPFWFRAITGWVPKNPSIPDKETREEKPQNKERVLIIWRKLTGDLEQDNVVLDEYFQRSGLSSLDSEFDTIYVNGSNNLPNLKLQTDRWRVVLLEEAFHKLMWDTQDV